MGGKTDYQAYSVTQGGVGNVMPDPVISRATIRSGATEPVWPTTEYATVTDGNNSPVYAPTGGGGTGGQPAEGNFPSDFPYAPQGSGGLAGPPGGGGTTTPGLVWTAIYARKVKGKVLEVINPAVFQHDRTVYPHHYFQYGVLTWLTGSNAGFTLDIRDSMGPGTQNGITSRPYIYGLELMPSPIRVGDTFEATVGCPKTRYACQQFNNMDNHRAFPDMPTEERALQTPNVTNGGFATPQNQK